MIERHLLALAGVVLLAGCATYHAYDGPPQPSDVTSSLSLVGADVSLDDATVPPGTRTLVMIPGPHTVTWTFDYPNGFAENQSLTFTAEGGHRYRLRERFFAPPSDLGPLGDLAGTALDIVFVPFALAGAKPEADSPPPGRYHAWIHDVVLDTVVVGDAPDVPPAHAPITFVPVE